MLSLPERREKLAQSKLDNALFIELCFKFLKKKFYFMELTFSSTQDSHQVPHSVLVLPAHSNRERSGRFLSYWLLWKINKAVVNLLALLKKD